ncbi:replication-relaxation family protein [Enterococcus raffinosus]|jgi:hypothetical protein|uniref:replication-relaxation family protein n=1 Tax=Enterococcus raffinosus TaxID=71452 RepID=UPI001C1255D0|nr:replication-relaxation family protein [Enterococcus raffinosus]MBU5362649.1 replication-relaxation family protein [Enterococcus raffinosus]
MSEKHSNQLVNQRISRKQLFEIEDRLDDKDKELLLLLKKCRFLSTQQIRRIFFSDSPNEIAGKKRTNRLLNRLNSHRVIFFLERRIGGFEKGSSSRVISLTPAGYKLVHNWLDIEKPLPRKRVADLSYFNLTHYLAISEVYTQLMELQQQAKIEIYLSQFEPAAWRTYNQRGVLKFLKPDLYIELLVENYIDSYFLEIDLDSEPVNRIVKKCQEVYLTYYQSGVEQRQHDGVFPFIVWIVPSVKRRETLIKHLTKKLGESMLLFRVITFEEFGQLIKGNNEGGVQDDQEENR